MAIVTDLPLDIKILIACDIQTWIRLAFIDDEFKTYAYSPLGKRQFIMLFTIKTVNDRQITYAIFDKLHNWDDKPAVIYADGGHQWYQNGKLHRSDDKPAVIYANGGHRWYQNGVFIR